MELLEFICRSLFCPEDAQRQQGETYGFEEMHFTEEEECTLIVAQ
jgi:hypothetical protein